MKIFDTKQLKLIFHTLRLLPNLHIGSSKYHSVFPRKANVILYMTNRCDSRCKVCNHWQQTPKVDLPLSIIEKLLNSRSINKNGFLIEGGEAIFHPEFDKIMKLFKGRNFTLLSNGISTAKLASIVKEHKVPSVCISLDGPPQTYARLRGVDKHDDVLKTIALLKNKTDLGVSFTISPWNNFEDFLYVKKICSRNGIRLLPNIFSKMEYMGVKEKEMPIDRRFEQLDSPYVCLYNRWTEGKLDIPCLSMRFLAVIRPNGDVMLCQYKNIVLGNLHERSFDNIWNDENTKAIQKTHRSCNDCWVSSHRAFDAKISLLIKKLFPILR